MRRPNAPVRRKGRYPLAFLRWKRFRWAARTKSHLRVALDSKKPAETLATKGEKSESCGKGIDEVG